jgi:CubicO group peptidase (beta-lactamase class C family)
VPKRRHNPILFTAASLFLPLCLFGQSDWQRAAPQTSGLDGSKLQAMEAPIKAGEFKKIGSVLVARHGKLVYEGYFDGDATTLRNTRSATKSVTGILIGLAIQQGKLSGVDAKVLALLPERRRKVQNPDPRKEKITVEDLLTMSSPLECDDWNDYSRGNEERMYLVEDWTQFILDLPMRGRMQTGESPEQPKYGRNFSYCTGGVFMLSEIIGKTTGMRTDHFAHEKLFTPLGIKADRVVWAYSPQGSPMTGGGLQFTSPDLLKLGQLYLDGGKWQGKQLINADWVKRSTTPHAVIDDQTEYGYLWWLKSFKSGDRSYPAFFMTGNGGNKVVVFPSLDIVVVLTATNYNTRGMHELTEKLLTDYVLAAVVER